MNAIKSPKRGGSCTAWCGEAGERTDEEIQEDEGGQARAKAKKQAGPFVLSCRPRAGDFFVLRPPPPRTRLERERVGEGGLYVGCVGVVLYRSLCDCSSPGAERERKE